MPRPISLRARGLACLAALAAACGESAPPPPPPVIAAAAPALFCARQVPTRLDVTGSNLHVATAAGGANPAVWLERNALLDGTAVAKSSVQVDAASLAWAGSASFSFPAAPLPTPLEAGVYALWVQNPDDGVWGSLYPAFAVAPPPEVTGASLVADCASTPPLLILSVDGTGFLRVAGGAAPILSLADDAGSTLGLPATYLERCVPAAPGLVTGVDTCRTLVVELAPGNLVPGLWGLRVANPAPAACTSTTLDFDATAAACP